MDRGKSVVGRRTAAWLGSLVVLAAAMALVAALSAGTVWAQTNDRSVSPEPTVAGNVPGQSLGNINDAELWRALRQGVSGTVSIPNKQAGVLVQSEGDNWRAWRNGALNSIVRIATQLGSGGLWGSVASLQRPVAKQIQSIVRSAEP